MRKTHKHLTRLGAAGDFCVRFFCRRKTHFCHTRAKLLLSLPGKLCPKIYSVRFSIILLAGAVNSALLKIPHSLLDCRNADKFKSRFLLLTFSRVLAEVLVINARRSSRRSRSVEIIFFIYCGSYNRKISTFFAHYYFCSSKGSLSLYNCVNFFSL